MAKENISVKFLIHLVGERPALWDKTSDDYKDRALKETSWREICTYINENYYSLAPRAKEEFTRMIMKKWTHIRDSWVKSMKYGYDEVTKQPPKPYVYHNELKFMQKILKYKPPRYDLNMSHLSNMHFEEFYREKNETQNSNGTSHEVDNNKDEQENDAGADLSIESCKQEPNPGNIESKVTIVNKTEDMDDVDDWQMNDTEHMPIMEEQNNKQTTSVKRTRKSIFINSRNEDEYVEPQVMPHVITPVVIPSASPILRPTEVLRSNYHRKYHSFYENRHWNFFKGILPSVNDLDEDHVLQFQSGVIVLLQKLRESQKQMINTKSNWISSHSLYRGRGRKRKALHGNYDDDDDDNDDDDWANHNLNARRRKSTRQIIDPIAPEYDFSETECSSNN